MIGYFLLAIASICAGFVLLDWIGDRIDRWERRRWNARHQRRMGR